MCDFITCQDSRLLASPSCYLLHYLTHYSLSLWFFSLSLVFSPFLSLSLWFSPSWVWLLRIRKECIWNHLIFGVERLTRERGKKWGMKGKREREEARRERERVWGRGNSFHPWNLTLSLSRSLSDSHLNYHLFLLVILTDIYTTFLFLSLSLCLSLVFCAK